MITPGQGGGLTAKAHDDPGGLDRFMQAQESDYLRALSEIRAGVKRTHWMWFIFPQFRGLGTSATSKHFAIQSVAEARAYLSHPILGQRLRDCCEAILSLEGHSATEVFGTPDDLKLHSCVTLFAAVSPDESLFGQVLDKFFGGAPDEQTLRLIRSTVAS